MEPLGENIVESGMTSTPEKPTRISENGSFPVISHLEQSSMDEITPLYKKLPMHNTGLVSESTPLNGKIDNTKNPIQFNPQKNPRNIFNLTPNLVTLQKKLKLSNNTSDDSIVKTAYDMFDKSNVSFTSGNYSTLNSKSIQNTKKRLGNAIDYKDNRVSQYENKYINNQRIRETEKDHLSSYQSPTTMQNIHRIFSDPLYISNLTLLIQILLNTLMVLIFLGFGFFAFFTIKKDVDKKVQYYINDAIYDINKCKRDYMLNNCSPDLRVPALEEKCNRWENCMIQDPESVITSKAYFEVIADCMNSFFLTISLKTLLGIGCMLLFCIFIPNILFSRFRSSDIFLSKNSTKNDTRAQNYEIHTPVNHLENKVLIDKHEPRDVGSVRFDPNVNYSFYEDEKEDEGENGYKPLLEDGHIVEDGENDSESSVGNQRIMLSN